VVATSPTYKRYTSKLENAERKKLELEGQLQNTKVTDVGPQLSEVNKKVTAIKRDLQVKQRQVQEIKYEKEQVFRQVTISTHFTRPSS
jgi:hypothetical protein